MKYITARKIVIKKQKAWTRTDDDILDFLVKFFIDSRPNEEIIEKAKHIKEANKLGWGKFTPPPYNKGNHY